jgi:hypothetical protein
VAELVDARDLKSLDTWYRAGSIPALGTRIKTEGCGFSGLQPFVLFGLSKVILSPSSPHFGKFRVRSLKKQWRFSGRLIKEGHKDCEE